MRKLLLLIGIFIMTASGVLAAKFPEEVKGYIKDNVPKAEISLGSGRAGARLATAGS